MAENSSKKNIAIAYAAIREAIIMQQLHPGTQLKEQALCNSLNMGRSTVRNALQRLAADGVVELSENKGACVASFTKSQLSQLMTFKHEIACYAVKLSYLNYVDADFVYLNDCVLREQDAFERQDFQDYLVALTDFHNYIADRAMNSYLSECHHLLSNRLQVYLALYDNFYRTGSKGCLRSISKHTAIVEAIREEKIPLVIRTYEELSELVISAYDYSPANAPNPFLRQDLI